MIEQVWRDGGRFDGWSEYFSYDRWVAATEVALAGSTVDLDWYTTREREYDEVLPWDHLDSGLDKDWLWADWEDAVSSGDPNAEIPEVEDCRWTPCYDCGVCPEMNTEIQIGPTGRRTPAAQRCLRSASPPGRTGRPWPRCAGPGPTRTSRSRRGRRLRATVRRVARARAAPAGDLAGVRGRRAGRRAQHSCSRGCRGPAATGRWGYLANCYVRAQHRNSGLGARLLATCTAYADERAASPGWWPGPRSVPFYARGGFESATSLMVREPGAHLILDVTRTGGVPGRARSEARSRRSTAAAERSSRR